MFLFGGTLGILFGFCLASAFPASLLFLTDSAIG